MMSESKKNSKIEPIFISDEMLEEDNFDSKLRDKMIEDAEEIEKALETDPKLDGIEAPAGMLDSITASLKNQGYWEDEEASEVSVGQKEELTEIDAAEDEDILEQQEIMKKAAGAEGLSDDELFQLLSPEGKDVVKLGLQMKKRKRGQRIFINLACVVMVIGGIFGLSMTSDANRKYVIGIWNSVIGNELSIHVDDSDNELKEYTSEEYAYGEIQNKLGVQYIELTYRPEELIYDKYYIDDKIGIAKVSYMYGDTVALFHICKGNGDTSQVQKFDGSIKEYTKNKFNEIEWKITELDNPDGSSVYVAQANSEDACYTFRATMDEEEFINIIKNIIIN